MQDLNTFKVIMNVENILDSYIYSGNLISVFTNGDIKILPLTKIFYSLRESYKKYDSYLEIALLRNDWFDNPQGSNFLRINAIYREFIKQWNVFAGSEYIYDNDEDWDTLCTLPEMPVYDIKAYGLSIFFGVKTGLYEMPIEVQEYFPLIMKEPPKKIFDAKTIGISAKSGEIAISSGAEGLFHGTLWNQTGYLQVNQKPKAKISTRTNWIDSHNLINYESQTDYTYYENEIKHDVKRPFQYSYFDDSPEKSKITVFGKNEYPLRKLLENINIKYSDIIYSFNSNNSAFFFLNDGKIYSTNTRHEEQQMHFSRRLNLIPQNDKLNLAKHYGPPISIVFIPFGTIIEFFDCVMIKRDIDIEILSDEPAISVRTFPSSKRYKRMVCITTENGIKLNTIPISTIQNKSKTMYWRKK
jgi:hypothetical protein